MAIMLTNNRKVRKNRMNQKCLDKMVPLIKMGIRFQRSGKIRFFRCGRNSAVECQLPKLDVVGSSPIARSNKIRGLLSFRDPLTYVTK
jgi:hypothetical protein